MALEYVISWSGESVCKIFENKVEKDWVDQNSLVEVYRNWHWKWTECWWCRGSYSKKILEMAKHYQTVVSNNTDILVLLMYYWCSTMKDVVFSTSISVKKKVHVEYFVRDLLNKQPLTSYMLFANAWTGCGTTSAIQSQEKRKILQQPKLFQVQESVSCFWNVFSTTDVEGKSVLDIFLRK